MTQKRRHKAHHAFTLAELLIALAILGVIATFTIPKVLQVQQGSAWNSTAKEVAGAISEAYIKYKVNNMSDGSTKAIDIAQYFNYVSRDTSATSYVDDVQNSVSVSIPCSTYYCYRLHNGGVIAVHKTVPFGGTAITNFVPFYFDPDGKVTDSTTNGPGRSVQFMLYFNGYITTPPYGLIGSCHGSGCPTPVPSPDADPLWFSWN